MLRASSFKGLVAEDFDVVGTSPLLLFLTFRMDVGAVGGTKGGC